MARIWPPVILLSLAMGACSIQRSRIATQAKETMVGMNKEQVLACMGGPGQRTSVGQTEVWSYASGGDSAGISTGGRIDQLQNGGGLGLAFVAHRYCVVNVVMTDGVVDKVNYSGRTGGPLSPDEQCEFAIRNCIQ
jgi:hypothetical protein